MSSLLYKDLNAANEKYVYNIVDDFPWTITKNRTDVPRIILTEFEQDQASLYGQLKNWSNFILKEDNPYKGLYQAKPTGTVYTLPYFEEYDHLIAQNWEKYRGLTDWKPADALAKMYTGIQTLIGTAPVAAMNFPKIWSSSNTGSYTISFVLFNTIDPKNDIDDNFEFKKRIQMSTLHNQVNTFLAVPPAIFTVLIPGVRWSPAAIISQLSVTNMGQINYIDKRNIPDAWKFDIQITELISESRQILDDELRQRYGAGTITAMDEAPNAVQEKANSSVTTNNEITKRIGVVPGL